MELVKNPTPNVTYTGKGDIPVSNGKHFKVETTPNGEDVLDVGPPEGKKWLVGITINVVETDE